MGLIVYKAYLYIKKTKYEQEDSNNSLLKRTIWKNRK